MHRAGRIRILATSGGKRLSQLPEVATFAEQGFPHIVASGWVGIFAPADTPRPIIDEWSAALVTTVRSAASQQRLINLGVEPTGTSPDEFAAIVEADVARWAPIIKLSGFQAE
ncbi:tripartite tricarboxylate transporter substrate-binding protein [Variovorax sp. J31P179]|nr:tripartite tricarboxylate transporter substrate-binding protein [Variovorax sp. J31P179]